MEKIKLHHFENLSVEKGIKHFISGRTGGVSKDGYSSLNIGLSTDDSPENVVANRKKLAAEVGIPSGNFVFQNQVHHNTVKLITEKEKGAGTLSHSNAIADTDAMITNTKGICITLYVADCVPIILFDPVTNSVGVAHSGWQSTLKNIAGETVSAMQKAFGTKPENIIAGIGPSISQTNFEIGEDVVKLVHNAFENPDELLEFNEKSGKFHLDLWLACQNQLTDAGLTPYNIEIMNICSYGNNEQFFSARREVKSGRFAAGIILI